MGNFTNETNSRAPDLINLGMITDASFIDIDSDKDKDLIVIGEYMGLRVFENKNGVFNPVSNSLENEKGWWNTIHSEDINNDGMIDLIVGNLLAGARRIELASSRRGTRRRARAGSVHVDGPVSR